MAKQQQQLKEQPPVTNVPATFQTREVEFFPLGESQLVKLSITQLKIANIVRPTKSGVMPDDGTIFTFMQRCKAQQLNPFVGDAFLIGFDTNSGPEFSLVTAIQSLFKRAELSPDYDGLEAGIIALDADGEYHDLVGDFLPKGLELAGAWAKCYRKNRKYPDVDRLNLSQMAKPFGQWKSNPQGMIVKCAQASVLRQAFPLVNAGLYLSEELQDDDRTVVAQAKPRRISDMAANALPVATPIPAASDRGAQTASPQNSAVPAEEAPPTVEEVLAGLEHDLSQVADYASAVAIASAYTDRNPPLEDAVFDRLTAEKQKRGWK